MKETELKPCPFCGEKAIVWDYHDIDSYIDEKGYQAGCNNEECLVGSFTIGHEKKEDAIKAWNFRSNEK